MNKYRNVPTVVDNIRFASKAEAKRYRDLKLLEAGGKIGDLECQPRIPLVVNGVKVGVYVADFSYFDAESGMVVLEDVKGVRTPLFKLKKALVKALYGREIVEVEG